MHNFLPVVVIGGPPHAGKSVLFYSLTQALHARNIPHHILRACPDGEGNWSQESTEDVAMQHRDKLQGPWPAGYIQYISLCLQRHCLPLLVDMGGRPCGDQLLWLRQCTHAILLARADNAEATTFWTGLIKDNALQPLAMLTSQLEGESQLVQTDPMITGTITGLVRYGGKQAEGPVFDALVERIAALFETYTSQDIEQIIYERAKGELLDINVVPDDASSWLPGMLPSLLDNIGDQSGTLSVYGRGPNWLYAALATASGVARFYQYDPKLPTGWIEPVCVTIGEEVQLDYQLQLHTVPYADTEITILACKITEQYLDYFRTEPFVFPSVSVKRGLILSGRYPHWLLTALVRLYRDLGVPWIAVYYPQLNCSIVTYSRTLSPRPGDMLAIPFD